MPRDDLSIDGFNRKNMPTSDHQDAAAVLDDFVNRVANLPLEIQFMQEEIAEKDRQITILLDAIQQRDNAIQKFIKNNHSIEPNPKEAAMRKQVLDNYDKVEILQAEKVALADKSQRALDRQIRTLDKHIKSLQDRGEFPNDPEIPSLLRPEGDKALEQIQKASKPAIVAAQNQAISTPQAAAARLAALQNGTPRPPTQTQVQAAMAGRQSTPTAGSPAAALIQHQQQQRESSAGASNKRQRVIGGVGTAPTNSSGLARHSSTGPGTPKAGTPTGTRAGSAGPARGQKTVVTKKTAPHKQGGIIRKAKPGKSGLSRVKRSGHKNSPGSNNDSELSDAESGASVDDDEAPTPPAGKKDDDAMDVDEDDAADDRKYCICQTVSFGDMVACDNDDCPNEWFHWGCVGLKSEPTGAWFCPDCTKVMKDEKKKDKKTQEL